MSIELRSSIFSKFLQTTSALCHYHLISLYKFLRVSLYKFHTHAEKCLQKGIKFNQSQKRIQVSKREPNFCSTLIK